MCDPLGDAFDFVKDSVGEVFKHPGEALGAAFGVPGYDPFIGGLFNSDHSLLSPTGNFTSSAWNDMYNDNPEDSGALGTFQGVNAVADKVAPALAGGFASGALGGVGAAGDSSVAGIGADTFSSGVGSAGSSTLGGLESGMGGAGLFGAGAGTGTAIGSGVAQGLGAGGLGVADASALGGLASSGGTYAAGLGGGAQGTGLGSLTSGGASPTGAGGQAPPVDLGGSGTSMEGSQAAAGGGGAPGSPVASGAIGNPGDASGAYAPSGSGTNLSTMFGANSTGAGSPMGTAIGQSTTGVGAGPSGGAFDAVTSGANGVGATDIPGQSIGSDYGTAANSADQGGDFLSNLFRQFGGGGAQGGGGIGGTGIQGNDIMNLLKVGQSAWQQHQASQKANAYAGSISSLFGPSSPYAQQMAQTLARQDAAAGRNSQYGNRSTQLAAALTQAQAQALGSNNYSQAAQNTSGTNVLNGIFNAFGSPQGTQSAGRLGSAAFNGLSSLFGG